MIPWKCVFIYLQISDRNFNTDLVIVWQEAVKGILLDSNELFVIWENQIKLNELKGITIVQ